MVVIPLGRSVSTDKGEIGQVTDFKEQDHGAESELSRSLESRHLLMFSIGSSIGMALWLGSGTSLINGGPAAIFLGYCIAGSIAWALSQAVGELAVLYPLASAFPQWASKFIDKAPAFTVGWAYWFSASITLANELQGVVTVLSFWTQSVPTAAWLSIFLVVILLVVVCAVRIFGEAEAVMSTIKLFWIVVVIISCIIISAGGAPNHQTTGFQYWNSMPFTNGFKGFLSVMATCIFAMGGTEFTGLAAAEARNPLKSVPKAVNSIWLRLTLFYVIGGSMVTITVSPKDPDLFGGAGVNASPYVIAFRNAGISGLAHAMNAVIFISVVSSGNAQAYAATRTVVGLANLNMAPAIFKRCDRLGRPWAAIIITFLVGGGLSYLNVSNSGATVFGWLSSLTALCILWLWGTIFLCHLRFRLAWKAQGRSVEDLPWKSWAWPFGTIYGLTWCILLVIVEFYLSVWPLGKASSAKEFFANYISIVAIVILLTGSKIYYRGPLWISAKDIDLDTGRRYYVSEDLEARVKSKSALKKVAGFIAGESKI
ncbi:amino acid permease/ SLC12A domain-containing protein [Aspergillus avenaceus]|uniref:Amino acid permease/ SLC12A domain-containing protein n=1 Tax=Aspergillus avenaceus TaxID=36643 RepID=A0A5N6TYN1_ASPAV|nr:amino acid permease/ SLC12A domain-containing protein [Aspergillus avenaceus]